MRAVIYLRQSSDRHSTELGIERQREDVERLINSRRWTVVDTFVDNDVSATSRKPRPEFERMMTGVDEGRYDVIVSRHMDRLLRRIAELETVLDRCNKHGVVIVTAADGVDTSTDGGRLVARILASVGQGEVERKSARQRSATLQAAKQGRRVGGRRPFGYEPDGITIREDEAALIREAFADVLAGESRGEIVRRFKASGIKTTQGNDWSRSAVSDVLGNPRMAGLRRHRPGGTGSLLRTRPLEGVVGAAEWPGIVDEDTWRAAIAIMYPPERLGRKNGPVGLLTGVGVCGVCGNFVHTGGNSRQHIRTYRCRSMKHIARKAEPIEAYVEANVLARLGEPDVLKLFAPEIANNTKELATEADVVRRRLADVGVQFADGVLTPDQVRVANERLTTKLAELESALAATVTGNAVAELVHADDIETAWSALSIARRRTVIETLMVPVLHPIGRGIRTFRPESVDIEWRV